MSSVAMIGSVVIGKCIKYDFYFIFLISLMALGLRFRFSMVTREDIIS